MCPSTSAERTKRGGGGASASLRCSARRRRRREAEEACFVHLPVGRCEEEEMVEEERSLREEQLRKRFRCRLRLLPVPKRILCLRLLGEEEEEEEGEEWEEDLLLLEPAVGADALSSARASVRESVEVKQERYRASLESDDEMSCACEGRVCWEEEYG
ncbi:hypothetical protein BDQ17DRAFT_394463 [Cyathus striatus]|nr:hypothetical protein BDQ17DRAFT_394463 [Cyathus striatus]